MDNVDLGRRPETTVYHIDISYSHSLSLRTLNLEYLFSMALIIVTKYIVCSKRNIHPGNEEVNKIISQKSI